MPLPLWSQTRRIFHAPWFAPTAFSELYVPGRRTIVPQVLGRRLFRTVRDGLPGAWRLGPLVRFRRIRPRDASV